MLDKLETKRRVIYLSGPMTGYPEHNFAEFHRVATILRKEGHTVINPAETAGGDKGLTHAQFMRIDISYIMSACDTIVLLRGWEKSIGAVAEFVVARVLGIDAFAFEQEDSGPVELKINHTLNSWYK